MSLALSACGTPFRRTKRPVAVASPIGFSTVAPTTLLTVNRPTEEQHAELQRALDVIDAALLIANKPIIVDGQPQSENALREQAHAAVRKAWSVLEHEVLAPLEEDVMAMNVQMGVGWSFPAVDPIAQLEEIRTQLKRLRRLASHTVDFTIRTLPKAGVKFELVPLNSVARGRSGMSDQLLLNIIRGHYTLTFTDGNKRCDCKLELYDDPPTELICDLTRGGECTRR